MPVPILLFPLGGGIEDCLGVPLMSPVGNITDLSFDTITPAAIRRNAYVYGQPLKRG